MTAPDEGWPRLALLHSAGLVERSREGHRVHYRLSRRGHHLLALFVDDD
jgi:DNA-binding transcriptional regulator PaaX